jgi:hypothetical protein
LLDLVIKFKYGQIYPQMAKNPPQLVTLMPRHTCVARYYKLNVNKVNKRERFFTQSLRAVPKVKDFEKLASYSKYFSLRIAWARLGSEPGIFLVFCLFSRHSGSPRK